MQDFGRYGPQEKPPQWTAAMGRHHDQIRTLMFHHVVNDTTWLALLQKRFHTQVWKRLGDKLLEPPFFNPLHFVDRARIGDSDLAIRSGQTVSVNDRQLGGEVFAHITNVPSYGHAGVRIVGGK
jgi:hypothetical protein